MLIIDVILMTYKQNNASAKGGGLALGRSENPRVGGSFPLLAILLY
jgi:hypothetical protein